jgi:hypothetical protein
LTKKQIEDSPSLNIDKPVSQQFEEVYHGYYGWPTYWGGPFIWGNYPYILRDRKKWRDAIPGAKTWDPHLRSTQEVSGYHVHATDSEIGHIEDFIIDEETWAIRYLIIDTRNWWPGKKVLISPQWIDWIDWMEAEVYINFPSEAVKQSPEYTDESLLTRDYETELHRHYNRQGYWVDEPADKEKNKEIQKS